MVLPAPRWLRGARGVSAYLLSLTGLDFSLAVAVLLLSRVLVLLVDLSVSSASFLLLRGGPSVPADPA